MRESNLLNFKIKLLLRVVIIIIRQTHIRVYSDQLTQNIDTFYSILALLYLAGNVFYIS